MVDENEMKFNELNEDNEYNKYLCEKCGTLHKWDWVTPEFKLCNRKLNMNLDGKKMRLNENTIVIYAEDSKQVHIHQEPNILVNIPAEDLSLFIKMLTKIKELYNEIQ